MALQGKFTGKRALVTGADRGISINAIAPGGTATDMAENAAAYAHPALAELPLDTVLASKNALSRLAEPDEIASVVAFWLSPGPEDGFNYAGRNLRGSSCGCVHKMSGRCMAAG